METIYYSTYFTTANAQNYRLIALTSWCRKIYKKYTNSKDNPLFRMKWYMDLDLDMEYMIIL